MQTKMWCVNVDTKLRNRRRDQPGLDLFDEGAYLGRCQQPRITVAAEQRKNFVQAKSRTLKLFSVGQLRPLSSGQFIEFLADVAEVALKIFLHGTRLTVPFGALIGRGRQTVIASTEEVLAHRQLEEWPSLTAAPIALSRCDAALVCLAAHRRSKGCKSYLIVSYSVQPRHMHAFAD